MLKHLNEIEKSIIGRSNVRFYKQLYVNLYRPEEEYENKQRPSINNCLYVYTGHIDYTYPKRIVSDDKMKFRKRYKSDDE